MNKDATDQDMDRMLAEFVRTVEYIYANQPRALYKVEHGKRVPRVRFEAIAVGTNLALRVNPNLPQNDFEWLKLPEFEKLVRTDASNSGPRLRDRVEFVRNRLLEGAA